MELKPGYKKTDVGMIPEQWQVARLGELAELTSSRRIFESDYVPTGIPFYRGKEISLLIERKEIEDSCFISEKKFAEIKAQFGAPETGDILVTAVGTLGNVFVVRDEPAFYFKDGNLIWLRRVRGADSDFVANQLRMMKSEIVNGAIGSSQKALTIVVLQDVQIPVAPLAEQRTIAGALRDVDGLLGVLEKLIAKKRDIKQALMQQLLTGQQRLHGFDGEWQVKRLGELIEDIADGATPSTANPANFSGAIPWVVIDDIKDEITSTKTTLTERGLKSCAAKLWPAGTLILSTGATIGEVGIARVPVTTKQGICGLIVNVEKARADFLKYWFVTNKSLLLSKAQGTSIKEVRAPTLVKFQIEVPAVQEQTAIAAVLADVDAELAILEARFAKTRMLKQGMMQELLTGRTRLV